MNKRLLVFTADNHIAQMAWKRHPDIKGDSYRGFGQVVAFCTANADQVAGLVLGGDTFDAKPEAEDVELFLHSVTLLRDAKIPIYAIQGQHGRSRAVPWVCVDPYVRWLHGMPPQELPFGRHLSGIDNLPPDLLQEALKHISPKTDILTLHQAARGSLPEIEGQQNWDFDPVWTPRHVRLVLLGDIHKLWEHQIKYPPDVLDQAGAFTNLMYSGSTAMQSIDEDPRKSFVVVDLETLVCRRETLVTRPFVTLTFNNDSEVGAGIEIIKRQAPATLVVVRSDSRIPDVESRCKEANKDAVFIFRLLPLERVTNETVSVDDFIPEQITLRGCLGKAINHDEKPRLHDLVFDLLSERDSKKVLLAHKTKLLETPVK